MWLGIGALTFALQSARQAELGRDAELIEFKSAAKFFLRLRILLLLGIKIAEEVVGVSVVRRKRCGFVEFGERLLRLSVIAMQQAEVVPHRRIAGTLLRSLLQSLFRLFHLRQIQVRDSQIERDDGILLVGIEAFRLLKLTERLIQLLLVHVGDAKIVGAHKLLSRR